MPAQLINGRALAKEIRQQLKAEIAEHDLRPGLGVILVGDDPASRLYVDLKEKACRQVDIDFEKKVLPASADEVAVLAAVDDFNRRPDIDAFIVQLPLPAGLDENRVIAHMNPGKDADGFHPDNLRSLAAGGTAPRPVLSQAVQRLIQSTRQETAGWSGLVVSNSPVFHKPLEIMLKSMGITSRWLAPTDPNLEDGLRRADLTVVAVGRPGFIRGGQLKPGSTVIDIGINRLADGSIVGDVEAASAKEVVAWLTPVPGGVGPVTVACLLSNTVLLAKQRRA